MTAAEQARKNRASRAAKLQLSLPSIDHHGSHRDLVVSVDGASVQTRRVDGVVVPTARPASGLREVARLARELDAPLIVLCSRSASPIEAIEIAREQRTRMFAIDLHCGQPPVPIFETDALLAATVFDHECDLSLKRNIGLMLAGVAGWKRILFLDDDISGLNGAHIGAGAGLLDKHVAVGLRNAGYPDNSVVCHAHRAVGGDQDTYIGAGAMLVAATRTRSFFPNVYNEDWFFLLGDFYQGLPARTGKVVQKSYDPFSGPQRARSEEFGDTVAEGLFWLLDEGKAPERADAAFWRDFLERRRHFIDRILQLVPGNPDVSEPDQVRIAASLNAARSQSSFITPRLCVEYTRAWKEDLGRWVRHVSTLPQGLGIETALAELGLVSLNYSPGVTSDDVFCWQSA